MLFEIFDPNFVSPIFATILIVGWVLSPFITAYYVDRDALLVDDGRIILILAACFLGFVWPGVAVFFILKYVGYLILTFVRFVAPNH